MENNISEEKIRLNKWLDKLNLYQPEWLLGDIKNSRVKTADFINNDLKFAIELKREKNGSLDNQSENVVTFSNRLEGYFESASFKFKNYPNYKTILIIEVASSIMGVAQAAMNSIPQLHFVNGTLLGASFKNKNLYGQKMSNIGCVILWPMFGGSILNNVPYYFDNPFCTHQQKVSQDDAEFIIGNKLTFLEINNT